MLSFDFMTDGLVYSMPLEHVGLFAGMLSRADNMGRLPGEPSVLLQFLFFPKPPRPDVTEASVQRLLESLAASGKVRWYAVNGTRYVEFASWWKHQAGIKQQNRKSSYPSPDDGRLVALPLLDSQGKPMVEGASTQHAQLSIADLVSKVAGASSMQRVVGFDADAVSDWVRDKVGSSPKACVFSGRSEWLKFAHWLYNTGTTRMQDVLHVLDECLRLQPQNPWAYFHQSKGTRSTVQLVKNARAVEAEHEAMKAEDRARLRRAADSGDKSAQEAK
jgi:hypothetical protein